MDTSTTQAVDPTTTANYRRPLPPASDHAPVSLLNTGGTGIRTMIGCSCGWAPRKAPASMRVMHNGHAAHRRTQALPPADYSATVFGEGPWAGWTWDQWYKQFGGHDTDPYTGQQRR